VCKTCVEMVSYVPPTKLETKDLVAVLELSKHGFSHRLLEIIPGLISKLLTYRSANATKSVIE